LGQGPRDKRSEGIRSELIGEGGAKRGEKNIPNITGGERKIKKKMILVVFIFSLGEAM